jgi:cysteine-rich repeat protein
LTPNHWYLRYTVTGEAPISGTLDWATLFAKETDLGTQVGSHGGSAIHGGGAQAWDWDCGWGVEVIPLEFPGFRVIITSVGVNQYKVFLVPSSQDVSTRASQESVDEIKDLLTNNTFGLEEIKNEIKNIESKITGSTIASSTLYFQGTLTYNIDGTFTGVLPMVNEGGTNSGFDIYAKEGSTAWFGDAPGPVWTSQAIGVDHDAWSTYNPDTPDWYQYSLELDGTTNKWAVRNHAGAEASDPWYEDNGDGTDIARGVPMSGTMDWNTMYAAETDTGAYLPTTGTPEIDGGAATHGGGPQAWDMDWSWGTEVVPLEFPGFDVQITSLGDNEYRVSLIPAPEVKLDSRSSQESVDKIFGIVSNETFGLEEIKDEVRSIETEIHNITYGLPALLTSIQNMYNYLQNTINVALTSIQTKVNTLNTANLDATVSSRASQTSVDTVNTNVNTVKNEILDSGHGLTEIKREIKDIEVNITDMRDKINLIYILLTQHCGNNITDFGEQCDDGDRDNGDGCDSNCQLEICGNGIKQGNEQCDDGNSNNNDACLNNCSLASCGDGYKYAVNEQCDKTDLGGASCISLAYDGGSLSCALNCYYDASNCWDAACSSNADCPDQTAYHCVGNNVWKDFKDYYCEHPGQQNAHCEFTETDNQWAVCSLPNVCVPGNAACQPPGPFCGDGIINYTNEQCDYENLDGKSCLDFGFNDGYLSCNATCKFNTSGCCNITCDTHSDCGTNNQAYICTTNDVYQQTTTYSCISGETCSAHCSTVIGTTIIDNCDDATERCVVGNPVCQPIPKNPFNATLVTDLSASMNTTPLNYAKDADKAFVNTALANVNSRVGLVGFSTAVINFHALSDNKTSLINQIDGYAEQAFSCISCGIVKAVNITKGSRKAIVIVANGEANYVIAGFYHKILAKNEAIAKAKDAWEKDGIRVYAIALGNADTDLMQQIASVGNGQYYYSTGANLTTIYESLVVTISSI